MPPLDFRASTSQPTPDTLSVYRRSFWRLLDASVVAFALLYAVAALLAITPIPAAVVLVAMLPLGLFWVQASGVAVVFEAREREQQTGEGFYWFRGRLAAAIGYGAVAGSAAAVGLLLVIPGLALLARWCVGVPAVVDALHPSIRDGFDSSLELTRRDERGARRLVMATVGAAVVAHVLIAQAAAAATGVATAGWLGAFVADILVAPLVALAWTVAYNRLLVTDAVPAVERQAPAPRVAEPVSVVVAVRTNLLLCQLPSV